MPTALLAWRRTPPPLLIGGAEVTQQLLAEELAAAGWQTVYLGSHQAPWDQAEQLPQLRGFLDAHHTHYEETQGELRYRWNSVDCIAVPQHRTTSVLSGLLSGLRPDVVFTSQEGAADLAAQARSAALVAGILHSVSKTGLGVLAGHPHYGLAPRLEDGPLRDLNDALHTLHLQAGRPTLAEMFGALSMEARESISRSTLHTALTGPNLPRWTVIDAMVEILASRARSMTPEKELPRFDALWQRAALGDMPADARVEVPFVDNEGNRLTAELDPSSLLRQHLDAHPEDISQALLLLEALKESRANEHRQRSLDLLKFLMDKNLISREDLPTNLPMKTPEGQLVVDKPEGFTVAIDVI
ncbi:hypothetical protein ACFV7R_16105 [Streptomyces sp. NPDC059866]|uniref:hypothetical protein n=1 Tax=Streptomyces sp. NPDC059866 TaxID=3346978 RepID=UPI003651C4AE